MRAPFRPSREAVASLLPAGWRDLVFVALDVETTGLGAGSDRVVELGALRFRPSEGSFEGPCLESLVHPGRSIPPFVTGIHGIGDADVAGAPSFGELADSLLDFLRGAVLVAHNAPFDLGFLNAELERLGRPPLDNPVLDSLVLARAAFPGRSSYSLPRIIASLGIEAGRSHRALDDARAAARLFLRAAEILSPPASC